MLGGGLGTGGGGGDGDGGGGGSCSHQCGGGDEGGGCSGGGGKWDGGDGSGDGRGRQRRAQIGCIIGSNEMAPLANSTNTATSTSTGGLGRGRVVGTNHLLHDGLYSLRVPHQAHNRIAVLGLGEAGEVVAFRLPGSPARTFASGARGGAIRAGRLERAVPSSRTKVVERRRPATTLSLLLGAAVALICCIASNARGGGLCIAA